MPAIRLRHPGAFWLCVLAFALPATRAAASTAERDAAAKAESATVGKPAKAKPAKAKSAKAKSAKAKRATRRTPANAAKRHAAKTKTKRRNKGQRQRGGAEPATKAALASGKNMPQGFAWPPSEAMQTQGETCKAHLTELGVRYAPATLQDRIAAPITVDDMTFGGVTYASLFRKGPFVLDCHLAVVLAKYGQTLHALGVRQVTFSSIHRMTNVRSHGTTKPVLSRHALGLAMDIHAVTDAEGQKLVIGEAYKTGAPLLLAVEQALNASGEFRTVLTPQNDPVSHHDHFHIEVNVSYPEATVASTPTPKAAAAN